MYCERIVFHIVFSITVVGVAVAVIGAPRSPVSLLSAKENIIPELIDIAFYAPLAPSPSFRIQEKGFVFVSKSANLNPCSIFIIISSSSIL